MATLVDSTHPRSNPRVTFSMGCVIVYGLDLPLVSSTRLVQHSWGEPHRPCTKPVCGGDALAEHGRYINFIFRG